MSHKQNVINTCLLSNLESVHFNAECVVQDHGDALRAG